MSEKVPQPIFLRDYRAPGFRVDRIDLTLDIHDDRTDVTARLVVLRTPEGRDQGELELMGENMEFVSLAVDGRPAGAHEYALSKDRLVLHGVKADRLELEVKNRIHPQSNKALEGFYQSGDILCTQCEPEGFRKITYFIDRPDVMAMYRTTLIADKKRYPQLLSNGNRVDERDLPGGRHSVTWDDPFRKPSYLFAAVAGDLELARDTFTTRSGRKVALEVYVDKGQGKKTGHALRSLANAMKWDEDTFGLEYDLDIYMIVAVESFNFGAMENKGLNIFNSAYVLADPATATDGDFQGVEGVVGHEYFHNWTGNRVTCRDWFQLTLKEGLTVFRDQEFSADMLSRAVKRIEDVKRLKELQFPEDAGPLAHPIRPSRYIEINNFYTATVYEKGAEVIRMVHTLIGDAAFKRGITEYFRRHDGQAVTTEDFIAAMEAASGRDLRQFRNWYSRPGTPTLEIEDAHDAASGKYLVKVRQRYPAVGQERVEEGNVLHMPFSLALFSRDGKLLREETRELRALEEEFTFEGITEKPVASWNRGFAAPVHVRSSQTQEELLALVAHESDAVSRYEALQKVYLKLMTDWVGDLQAGRPLPSALPPGLSSGLSKILGDSRVDAAFKAHLFEVPAQSRLHQDMAAAAIDEVNTAQGHLQRLMGDAFYGAWEELYRQHQDPRVADLTAAGMGSRALKNRCLSMLVKSGRGEGREWLARHFREARTMTEEAQALALYCQLPAAESREPLAKFRAKWAHESLVMLRWFGSQAAYVAPGEASARLEELERDPCFRPQVPNDLRSLYQSFARQNLVAFHQPSGDGYRFLAERVARIDAFNPQVAARLSGAFDLMAKLDPVRKAAMRGSLEALMAKGPSKDVYEVVGRYLGQG